jgi:hypothetical protein
VSTWSSRSPRGGRLAVASQPFLYGLMFTTLPAAPCDVNPAKPLRPRSKRDRNRGLPSGVGRFAATFWRSARESNGRVSGQVTGHDLAVVERWASPGGDGTGSHTQTVHRKTAIKPPPLTLHSECASVRLGTSRLSSSPAPKRCVHDAPFRVQCSRDGAILWDRHHRGSALNR